MKRLYLFGLLVNISSCSPRYMHGQLATGDSPEFYYHVTLAAVVGRDFRKIYCGGTMVSPKTVLTAARCTQYDSQENDLRAVWGIIRTGIGKPYNDYLMIRGLVSFVAHPEYVGLAAQPGGGEELHERIDDVDIAVATLKKADVLFTTRMRPALVSSSGVAHLRDNVLPGKVIHLASMEHRAGSATTYDMLTVRLRVRPKPVGINSNHLAYFEEAEEQALAPNVRSLTKFDPGSGLVYMKENGEGILAAIAVGSGLDARGHWHSGIVAGEFINFLATAIERDAQVRFTGEEPASGAGGGGLTSQLCSVSTLLSSNLW